MYNKKTDNRHIRGYDMRLGTDIIEIERIKKAIDRSERFRQRVYTEREIAYCESKLTGSYQSYAGIYAAKEAFLKALGTGLRYGSWHDIEVCHDEFGAPSLIITGAFKKIMQERMYKESIVSISHCRSYAMSTVIIKR